LRFADVAAHFQERADQAIRDSGGDFPAPLLRGFIALAKEQNNARALHGQALARLRREQADSLLAELRYRFG
jgi:hypothetical protein